MKKIEDLWFIPTLAVFLKFIFVFFAFGFDILTFLYVGIETIIIVGLSVIIWYLTLKGGEKGDGKRKN